MLNELVTDDNIAQLMMAILGFFGVVVTAFATRTLYKTQSEPNPPPHEPEQFVSAYQLSLQNNNEYLKGMLPVLDGMSRDMSEMKRLLGEQVHISYKIHDETIRGNR